MVCTLNTGRLGSISWTAASIDPPSAAALVSERATTEPPDCMTWRTGIYAVSVGCPGNPATHTSFAAPAVCRDDALSAGQPCFTRALFGQLLPKNQRANVSW